MSSVLEVPSVELADGSSRLMKQKDGACGGALTHRRSFYSSGAVQGCVKDAIRHETGKRSSRLNQCASCVAC